MGSARIISDSRFGYQRSFKQVWGCQVSCAVSCWLWGLCDVCDVCEGCVMCVRVVWCVWGLCDVCEGCVMAVSQYSDHSTRCHQPASAHTDQLQGEGRTMSCMLSSSTYPDVIKWAYNTLRQESFHLATLKGRAIQYGDLSLCHHPSWPHQDLPNSCTATSLAISIVS